MSLEFQTVAAIPPTPAPSVTREDVTFNNRDMKVSGHLYAPKERVPDREGVKPVHRVAAPWRLTTVTARLA